LPHKSYESSEKILSNNGSNITELQAFRQTVKNGGKNIGDYLNEYFKNGYDVNKPKRNKYSWGPHTLRDLQPTSSEVRSHNASGQTQGKYK
jgi:hypothetical protein